jgi:hypothetical protein
MIYKAVRNEKKAISWAASLVTLGIFVVLGMGPHSSFYDLIGLILITGALSTFLNRKKPYFEINNDTIKVGRLLVSKSSIIEVDFFASGEGGAFTTIVLKLDRPLNGLVSKSLNPWEKYFNKTYSLGPQQISIDLGNIFEIKKHLPVFQEWLPGKVKSLTR